jgi:hypothetical protein
MNNYEAFISAAKEEPVPPDYPRLFGEIQGKVRRRVIERRALLAGGVLLFFLALLIPLSFSGIRATEDGGLVAYIFDHDPLDGVMLDYVFQ